MGKLTNLNPAAIADSDIPASIARDTETAAAIAAHISATDPHLQYATQARGDARYARYYNSFEEILSPPFSLVANTWQEVGSARQIGQFSVPTSWLINIYFQYASADAGNPGGPSQPWYQYCGAGVLGCVGWQADALSNQGIEIPIEAHNEADFTARIRFGRGQARKLEIAPSRTINISSPGFGKISGTRFQ